MELVWTSSVTSISKPTEMNYAKSLDEAKAACEEHWQAAMKEYLL